MKVLVVAPHPDDESIGCGGSLCLHAARGDTITVVFLTSGELGLEDLPPEEARRVREAEAAAAAEILGVAELRFLRQPDWFLVDAIDAVASLLAREVELAAPSLIYRPHPGEWHPDHRAAHAISGRVGPIAAGEIPTRGYEVWTPLAEFDDVEDITPVMDRKLTAIRAHASQLARFRYDQGIDGLNRFRGALGAHVEYAEVFASN